MNIFTETYTSFPSLPEDLTMPSFSDPSIESLFIALTAVKKRHTEYTNNPSKRLARYKAIETDLADVRQSLVKLFEKAEKTEIFKIEFAMLERFISTAWKDFDDGFSMVWDLYGLDRPVVFGGFGSLLDTRRPSCPSGRQLPDWPKGLDSWAGVVSVIS
ncbi:hypothetical protein Q9L58_006294 [Maublancomyces gigas]|uniref:Uncharacterized protein n=1 Tax=Discina gigas TaxID=1032678 RepID=A0ABR3GFP3_9PEZI